MKCPACENEMAEITVSDITFDACEEGGGGIWFDRFELDKVDEPHESAGDVLLDIERDESITVDQSERLKCPNVSLSLPKLLYPSETELGRFLSLTSFKLRCKS